MVCWFWCIVRGGVRDIHLDRAGLLLDVFGAASLQAWLVNGCNLRPRCELYHGVFGSANSCSFLSTSLKTQRGRPNSGP
jgi:hypothetical protein